MHARLDRGKAQLLTRTGLDWTHKYPSIAAALSALPTKQAYLDGEQCGITRDGKTSFSLMQTASDSGNAAALVFFLFDLLYLDGNVISAAPLRERKDRLRDLLSDAGAPLQYSDHQIGRGPGVLCEGLRVVAGGHHLEARGCALFARRSRAVGEGQVPEPRGVRSGRLDRSRRRPWLGALLLAYYDPDGRLVYAGRVGTGIGQAELGRLWRRLQPLAIAQMPLDKAPPRTNRFGSPLVLSRVHWVRPELVVEVKYLAWTGDNLLRQVVYEGPREDKDPTDVRRPTPNQSSR
jgi:ATP-dependent DNA ligase